MAIFDFLKNKEEAEKAKARAKKAPAKKVSQVKSEEKKEEAKEVLPKPSAKQIKAGAFTYEAIKQPHISEKASYLAEKDQYIFEVSSSSNKNEIKKSIEGIYHVDVLSVNVVRVPSKKRRVGKTEGFRKGYKKAVIKVKNGQKIEIL